MIPFGADSSMLFPRYITIPRGQFIVEFLAFAICPWKILASASVFTTFLGGYGLFMASVVAVMICDFYLLTRGNVSIGHCYDGSRSNKFYYYTMGWNLQAVFAYICGIALPFTGTLPLLPPFSSSTSNTNLSPGFVGTLGPTVSTAATDLGRLGWILSFFTTFIVYYIVCTLVPTQSQRRIREAGLKWEELSYEPVFAEDGTRIAEVGDSVYAVGEQGEKEAMFAAKMM